MAEEASKESSKIDNYEGDIDPPSNAEPPYSQAEDATVQHEDRRSGCSDQEVVCELTCEFELPSSVLDIQQGIDMASTFPRLRFG